MGSVPVKLNLVNYLILWMLTLYVSRKPKSQVSWTDDQSDLLMLFWYYTRAEPPSQSRWKPENSYLRRLINCTLKILRCHDKNRSDNFSIKKTTLWLILIVWVFSITGLNVLLCKLFNQSWHQIALVFVLKYSLLKWMHVWIHIYGDRVN